MKVQHYIASLQIIVQRPVVLYSWLHIQIQSFIDNQFPIMSRINQHKMSYNDFNDYMQHAYFIRKVRTVVVDCFNLI